jgi:hypothetical protein
MPKYLLQCLVSRPCMAHGQSSGGTLHDKPRTIRKVNLLRQHVQPTFLGAKRERLCLTDSTSACNPFQEIQPATHDPMTRSRPTLPANFRPGQFHHWSASLQRPRQKQPMLPSSFCTLIRLVSKKQPSTMTSRNAPTNCSLLTFFFSLFAPSDSANLMTNDANKKHSFIVLHLLEGPLNRL